MLIRGPLGRIIYPQIGYWPISASNLKPAATRSQLARTPGAEHIFTTSVLHHVLSGQRLTSSSLLVNLQGQLSVSFILWCINIELCPGRLRVKPPGPAPVRQVMAMHSSLFTMWICYVSTTYELWIKYYVNARLYCVLPIFANPSRFPAPSTTPRPEHYFHYVAYSPTTIVFNHWQFVCLFVCGQHYGKMCEQIFMTFSG